MFFQCSGSIIDDVRTDNHSHTVRAPLRFLLTYQQWQRCKVENLPSTFENLIYHYKRFAYWKNDNDYS